RLSQLGCPPLKFFALIAAISRNSRPGGGVIGASHEGGPMGSRNLKKSAAVAKAVEMVVQRLEERRMLSVTLDDGTWTIDTEDNRNHVISVDLNAAKTKLQ